MATIVINHGAKAGAAQPHEHRHTPRPASAERVPMPQVSVNGVAITRKAISAEVQNFPSASPRESWLAATRGLVVRELLLQEARRLAITTTQRTDPDGRRETEEDALIRALVEREATVPTADEATLRRYYDNNRARFVTVPLVEAEHILIAARADDAEGFAAARERAASIAAILREAPGRFGELAREFSACPSGATGGNLGQIGPGETTPAFEAALATLEPGTISNPVETPYGVHVIRVHRRIEGRQLPFEVVRERIAAYLDEHVRRRASAQYVALLAGRAEIVGIDMGGATTPLVQ